MVPLELAHLICNYKWLEMEQNDREKQTTNLSQMIHRRSHSDISLILMCTLFGAHVQRLTLH